MSESPKPAPPSRWSRARRVALRVGLGGVALAAAWLVMTVHPQPLFAYTLRRANIVLHARAPLPPEAGPILDEVVRRVARSPLRRAVSAVAASLGIRRWRGLSY